MAVPGGRSTKTQRLAGELGEAARNWRWGSDSKGSAGRRSRRRRYVCTSSRATAPTAERTKQARTATDEQPCHRGDAMRGGLEHFVATLAVDRATLRGVGGQDVTVTCHRPHPPCSTSRSARRRPGHRGSFMPITMHPGSTFQVAHDHVLPFDSSAADTARRAGDGGNQGEPSRRATCIATTGSTKVIPPGRRQRGGETTVMDDLLQRCSRSLRRRSRSDRRGVISGEVAEGDLAASSRTGHGDSRR